MRIGTTRCLERLEKYDVAKGAHPQLRRMGGGSSSRQWAKGIGTAERARAGASGQEQKRGRNGK